MIQTEDFRFVRPLIGFETFAEGELIATDGPDEIRAPCDDCTDLHAGARADRRARGGLSDAAAVGVRGLHVLYAMPCGRWTMVMHVWTSSRANELRASILAAAHKRRRSPAYSHLAVLMCRSPGVRQPAPSDLRGNRF